VKHATVLFVAKIAIAEEFLKPRILLHPEPKISGAPYPEIHSLRFSIPFGAPAVGICPGSPISPPRLTPACWYSLVNVADAAVM
jgi:hypothetical protein